MGRSTEYAIKAYVLLALSVKHIRCQAVPVPGSLPAANQSLADAPALRSAGPPRDYADKPDCELHVLTALGWQQAYNPEGYAIEADLPANCTSETWKSLGCLQSITGLHLTGILYGLPDDWASNGSFSQLRVLNITLANLVGSLPPSWAQPTAFPELVTLHFNFTQLTGSLPEVWAHGGGFQKLESLTIANDNIAGQQNTACCGVQRQKFAPLESVQSVVCRAHSGHDAATIDMVVTHAVSGSACCMSC